ncbi:MAG TPA: hypothetical protein VD837_10250 [Terriglobales bacterium]|nr:hypothetical protein [Terriglobales bacterium]
MLHRFVAASVVASVLIAIGAVAVVLMPAATARKFYPVALMWCFMPLIWGVWAVLTPAKWMTHRLPQWGAVLGFVLGLNATFVLHTPTRVLDVTPPWWGLLFGAVFAAALYYLLWMVVRIAYRSLMATASATPEQSKAARAS